METRSKLKLESLTDLAQVAAIDAGQHLLFYEVQPWRMNSGETGLS